MNTLPDDMLLHIFSFLRAEDLNTMQLVRQHYCNLINFHCGRLYSSRSLEMDLQLDESECEVEVIYDKFSLKLNFDALTCTRTEIGDGRNMHTMEEDEQSLDRESLADAEFLNQPLGHCLLRLLLRSAGIGMLDVKYESTLNSPFFNDFEELIRTARQLCLYLHIIDVPVVDAYRSIFSPRRSLSVRYEGAIERGEELLDDRFFAEAGAGQLELILEKENQFFMTVNQLDIVLGRDDLSDVRIEYIGGPASSCETLKSTIQRLLLSGDKSVAFTFSNIPWPGGREMLTSIEGFLEERTSTIDDDEETIFIYQHQYRVVSARMFMYYDINVEIKC